MRNVLASSLVLAATLLGARSAEASCTTYTYRVPGYIQNLGRGDVVFRRSSNDADPVTRIMHDMGLTRIHVGLGLSNDYIRHNTRSMDNPSVDWSTQTLDANWLRYGRSTDGVQNTNAADFASGVTATILNSARPWNTDAVASRLQQLSVRYSFYAYTHEDVAYYYGGDMCSGTILEASQAAPNGFSNVFVSDYERTDIAWRMYNDLVNMVQASGVSFLGIVGPNASGIATQIVNCFAFEHCGDIYRHNWVGTVYADGQYVGTGRTIRPDDVYNQARAAYYAGVGNWYPDEQPAAVVPSYYESYEECTGYEL